MDNLVTEATIENIRDTFEKDSIGRKEKVLQFVKLLNEADSKMVFQLMVDGVLERHFLLSKHKWL